MDTAQANHAATSGDADGLGQVWNVSEPTFGMAHTVMFRITRDAVVFDEATPLEIRRDRIDRIELQDWWEKYRRIHLSYRDENNEPHARTFVATRLLGPDADATGQLFGALSREVGGKAVQPTAAADLTVVEKPKPNPRRTLGLLLAGVLPVAAYVLTGPLPAIAAAVSIILLLCVSREGAIWRRSLVRSSAIVFAIGCVLLPVVGFGWRVARFANATGLVQAAPAPSGLALPFLGNKSAPVAAGADPDGRLAAIAQKKRANQTGYPIAEEAQPAIQAAATALGDALWHGDKTAYFAHVDQTNQSWKEVQTDWFNGLKGKGRDEDPKLGLEVLQVEPLAKGYYRAEMRITTTHHPFLDGVERGNWIFRVVDGKWYLSEPDERELGNRLAKETEKVSIVYWEWDKDKIDNYAAWAEAAYARVAAKLGREPEKKPRVIFRPIFRNYRADFGLGELGFFHTQIPDEVYVRSPYSFGGSGWKDSDGPDSVTVTVITHELTHLFQQQRFVAISTMPLWMTEGLAEHVAGDYRLPALRWAAREGHLLSVARLDRLDIDENAVGAGSIVYGEGAMLVRYIDERWGMDTYWELAKRYAVSRRSAKNIADVLGISIDELDSAFQPWLRAQLAE